MTDRTLVEVNGIRYRLPVASRVVICIDGNDPDYFAAASRAGVIPTIDRFVRAGFGATADAAVPTFTCPNNVSIATGRPPNVHGISGNFYLDRGTGAAVVMTGPELMRAPTLFAGMAGAGLRTVIITAKDKLRQQLGKGLRLGDGNACFSAQCADACTLADHGIADALAFVGQPLPDLYSAALSFFVLDAGIRFLEQPDPPRVMYLSLSDYIQHKCAPDEPEALAFYAALDGRFARLDALGAVVGLIADHGMSDKCAADGRYNIVYLQDRLDERFGAGSTRVICPITDAFVGHHGALGGFVRVYCSDGLAAAALIDFCRSIEGIDAALGRQDVAARFDLPEDVEGDVAVLAEEVYCLGMRDGDHDLSALKGARLRSHGGLSERTVPFVLNRPLNETYRRKSAQTPLRNYQIFDYALNGTLTS
jgi:phosphonoacetate hydrolase